MFLLNESTFINLLSTSNYGLLLLGHGSAPAWGLKGLPQLNKLEFSFPCPRRPYSTIASLGEHDVTVEEGTEQHIYVADVIYHSPYRSPLHSLTMVRLAKPARFTQYVQSIPLPSRCPQPGDTCHVSGWGSTIPNQCKWI